MLLDKQWLKELQSLAVVGEWKMPAEAMKAPIDAALSQRVIDNERARDDRRICAFSTLRQPKRNAR